MGGRSNGVRLGWAGGGGETSERGTPGGDERRTSVYRPWSRARSPGKSTVLTARSSASQSLASKFGDAVQLDLGGEGEWSNAQSRRFKTPQGDSAARPTNDHGETARRTPTHSHPGRSRTPRCPSPRPSARGARECGAPLAWRRARPS